MCSEGVDNVLNFSLLSDNPLGMQAQLEGPALLKIRAKMARSILSRYSSN